MVLITINKIITSRVFYILKLLLNNLLLQTYVVEILLSKKVNNLLGIDSNVLLNILQGRVKGLKKFHRYKKNNRKIFISISCIADCLIEQLLLLVLGPILETNVDLHSYGFRKSRNSLMAINHIYRNLQSKIIFKRISLKSVYL